MSDYEKLRDQCVAAATVREIAESVLRRDHPLARERADAAREALDAYVASLEVRVSRLERVAAASEELTRWDWLGELRDGPVAADVRKDVAALEAALKDLDDEAQP